MVVSVIEKACACGTVFTTKNKRQVKCRPSCGYARKSDPNSVRTAERAAHVTDFIGVDGEGVSGYEYVIDYDDETGEEITVRRSVHHYVLLSVGDQSLHKDGRPLTHDEVFGFLWERYQANPNSAFVGFFLGYDFTNWLKTIPEHAARSLLTKDGIARRKPTAEGAKFPFPVRDGHWRYVQGFRRLIGNKWEFDILANKRFKLRPYIAPEDVPTKTVKKKDGTIAQEKIPRPWMYICDTGPFFQTSFLNAINPKDWATPIVTQAEYDRIEEGKQHRSDAAFDAEMIEYNLLENEVLSRLMATLNEGFLSDGIKLNNNQWFGPGQAAQTWMRLIGVPTGEEIREVVPAYAREAAIRTYYGGWFEIFNHGPVPGVSYAYDINSAYPAVIEKLPCLLHGVWSEGTGSPGRLPKGALRMVYATVQGKDMWVGAMPHRTSDGAILRPRNTKGWYWWHELEAAKRAGVVSRVSIHQHITYRPCACEPPMRSIRELYEGRLSVGKNTPSGKAKKLVYNSAYGKLAQSVGEPRFSNPIWASLITAGCRTMILDAIATHPTKTESLLMIATDGIVFKDPHPALDIDGKRLGAWDAEEYHNLSLFMPGLYWDDKARRQLEEGTAPKLKSRGVAAKDLGTVISRVDKAWGKIGPDYPYPIVELSVSWAMVSAKQAIVRNHWESCGRVSYGEIRKLSGDPGSKRDPDFIWWDRPGIRSLRSFPYEHAEELETTYYNRTFGETMEEEADEVAAMETPDGTVGQVTIWAMRR